MPFTRRRLPHLYEITRPIFVTWPPWGSLPANRHFDDRNLTPGAQFAAMDRLLDHARTGPLQLAQPDLARIVVDALHFNAPSISRRS